MNKATVGDGIESQIGLSIDLGVIFLMNKATVGDGIESQIGLSTDLESYS